MVFCFGIPVYALVLVALHVTADNPQEIKKRRLPDAGVIVSIGIMAICIIIFIVRKFPCPFNIPCIHASFSFLIKMILMLLYPCVVTTGEKTG